MTAALSVAAGPSTHLPLPGHQTTQRTSANVGMTPHFQLKQGRQEPQPQPQPQQQQLENMMQSVDLDYPPPQIGIGTVLGASQQGFMTRNAHHQSLYLNSHMASRNQWQMPAKAHMSSGQPDFSHAPSPPLPHLHANAQRHVSEIALQQLGLLGNQMVPKLGPSGHSCIPTSFETPVFKLFLSPPSLAKAALQWWILDQGKVHGPFSGEQMIIGYVQKLISDSISVTGISDDGQPVSLPALSAFLPLGPLLQSVSRGLSYKPQSHSPLADKIPDN